MFSVAICDNEAVICEQMESFMRQYRKEKNADLEFVSFPSGESLYAALENGDSFDLIFLDIEMYQLSGIDVARLIREKRKDFFTQIVFISAKQEYAAELFDIHPLNFVLKPLPYERIRSCVDKAVLIKSKRGDRFVYSVNGEKSTIPMSRILYFENNNRKIRMVTFSGSAEIEGRIGEMTEKYRDNGFVRIHRSYLVNMEYIESFTGENVRLANGAELALSREYRKNPAEALLRLCFEGDNI